MARVRSSALAILLLLAVGCGSSNRNSEFTSDPPTTTGTPFFIFAGTSTQSFNRGITTFKSDRSTGAFQRIGFVEFFQDADRFVPFLRLDPKNHILLATVSGTHSDIRPDVHNVFTVDANAGTIEFLGTLPLTGTGAGFFDPQGQFLFFSTFSQGLQTWGGITVFQINPDLTLSTVAGSPFGQDLQPLARTPDGKLLLAWSGTDASMHTFSVGSSGALNQISTSPLGGKFHSLVMHPSGKFAYDVSVIDGALTQALRLFQIDSTTGQVSVAADLITGMSMETPVLHPSGRFLYEAYCEAQIPGPCHNDEFEIAADGTLKKISSPLSDSERIAAFDSSGRFAYIVTTTGQLQLFHVDQATGNLSATSVSSPTDIFVGSIAITN